MYFKSRAEAGAILAARLGQYMGAGTVVVAMNDAAILVADVIARALYCRLALFVSEAVELPGESMTIGTVSQSGGFTYNSELSSGEIDEYYSEFHGYIDDQKREKTARINRLVGDGGLLDRSALKHKTVILVSDGLSDDMRLVAAEDFLKPIKMRRLVIVTPVASVQVVDKMHILADELHCLNVTSNYISTDHYYDTNVLPSREEIVSKIKMSAQYANPPLPESQG